MKGRQAIPRLDPGTRVDYIKQTNTQSSFSNLRTQITLAHYYNGQEHNVSEIEAAALKVLVTFLHDFTNIMFLSVVIFAQIPFHSSENPENALNEAIKVGLFVRGP